MRTTWTATLTRIAGSGFTAKAPGPAIGIWSGSFPTSMTQRLQTGSRSRSAAEEHSAVSRTRLSRWTDLFTRWHAFSENRQRGRARAWLVQRGYLTTLPDWPGS